MFDQLEQINARPKPFEYYTASDLWTDEYTSEQMLSYHLNDAVDLSSRNGPFIDRSVAWIVSHFNLGPTTQVADFGCGPGQYANRLARQGIPVTGIDFSPRSIAYARQVAESEGLPVQYVQANYLDFETDQRLDLIIMIMCDFCVLSPEQRQCMLTKFYAHLKPGGAVLLDVSALPAFEERQEAAIYELNQLHSFWSPNPYYGFVNTFKYEDEKVVLDKYTIVEADRLRTVYNWFQYFSAESLQREFETAGFVVEETWGSVAGDAYQADGAEFAVVARRR